MTIACANTNERVHTESERASERAIECVCVCSAQRPDERVNVICKRPDAIGIMALRSEYFTTNCRRSRAMIFGRIRWQLQTHIKYIIIGCISFG